MKKYFYSYHTGEERITIHSFEECNKFNTWDTENNYSGLFHCGDCCFQVFSNAEDRYRLNNKKTQGAITYWDARVGNTDYYSFIIYFFSDKLLNTKEITDKLEDIYRKNILNSRFTDIFWATKYNTNYCLISPFIGKINSIEVLDKELQQKLYEYYLEKDFIYTAGCMISGDSWSETVKELK
ncbi:hypothetical protein [Mycoplasma seminis]|uniref:Uncharacterized protein n=1 Tax=Mycoplasma seminis TaxID=512749 RepID=A0ABY9HC15_9MOLU|nr:hypothetical protein [Mycoplasma seminis]WLP85218.1 hypothetical protein Q8852_02760 [Mycoplasma seminis]